MKVAICVGGLVYPDSKSLMSALRDKFPKHDFFLAFGRGERVIFQTS